jgi:aspartate aminotransferase-like enzyme
MPTDALRDFHEISVETLKIGLPQLKQDQNELGKLARAELDKRGLRSVAAPGFEAPGVLVYHSPSDVANPEMMNKFKKNNLQIAMGVPWALDEPEGMKTFRMGLFGLDKLGDINGTVDTLTSALDPILSKTQGGAPQPKVA